MLLVLFMKKWWVRYLTLNLNGAGSISSDAPILDFGLHISGGVVLSKIYNK